MISKTLKADMEGSSGTRKVYEEGLKLKKLHGEDKVVDFSLGNPVLEPPEEFNKILSDMISKDVKGVHRYMPNAGHKEVRDSVAYHLDKKGYLPGVTGDHVCMTVGAAGALNIIFKTILNKGEEVITINPHFQEYTFHIKNHQGEEVMVNTLEDYTLDLKAISKKITSKTKAILLNTPNNPTGVMYSKESLEELASILREKEHKLKKQIYLVSDEPYREMVYEGKFTSPASIYDNSFIVYSWSKSLSLPGERTGYAAVNPKMKYEEDMIKGLAFSNKILGFVSAPAMIQFVLPKILNTEIEEKYYSYMRDYYKSMHRPLEKCLSESGYEFPKPKGAFFFWAKCLGSNKNALEREKDFIEDAKDNFLTMLVPGSAFGKAGWFRISYASNLEVVNRGCERLAKIAEKYKTSKPKTLKRDRKEPEHCECCMTPVDNRPMDHYCDESSEKSQEFDEH